MVVSEVWGEDGIWERLGERLRLSEMLGEKLGQGSCRMSGKSMHESLGEWLVGFKRLGWRLGERLV